MKTLAIYGAGGLGREVLDLAHAINRVTPTWSEIVLINDFVNERIINGADVYTLEEFCAKYSPDKAVGVVAVGEPEVRAVLAEKLLNKGHELATLIHPSAFIGTDAKIGRGTLICYGSFISCNVKIGENVLVQPNANVGHDSVIGDYSIVSSFASLAGHVTVGSKTYIGMSVPIREGLSIGSQSIVGMGSVVLRDIPDNVRALGNPARAMKANDSKRVFS